MEQIFNPYLPLYEYIPDGEPHVFNDRIYIYGSHDKAGGKEYCEGHYQVWSAPVNNLKDWRDEGVSYRRDQDPTNKDDEYQLWAPDVTRGPDGRYYLYYCFNFYEEIGVAVSDRPEGPFSFYGHVHYPENVLNGKTLTEHHVFDPAVLTDDDGRVYLYYGFAPGGEKEMFIPEFSEEELAAMDSKTARLVRSLMSAHFSEYAMIAELESDMVTVKSGPKELIPGAHHSEGTGFEGHAFFEASSMRKISGKYYFIYSSQKSHELCFAVSDYPDRDFVYGGTIISNGDIGLDGNEDPVYPLSNNHGSIAQIGEDFYIFYHHATDGTEFSRQGCAEKIQIKDDGSIDQAEVTSCGLNGGPLKASGTYPAAIACHLTDPTVTNRIDYNDPLMKKQVRITQSQNVSYITGIKDHTVVGYKYFSFEDDILFTFETRGQFTGTVSVRQSLNEDDTIGEMELTIDNKNWQLDLIPVFAQKGTHPLYLFFEGEGELDLKTIGFLRG